MSARQRARVAHHVIPVNAAAQHSSDDESSEGEDIVRKVVTAKMFQFEASSSSSAEESETSTSKADKITNATQDNQVKNVISNSLSLINKLSSYDELAYLDAVIIENSNSQTSRVAKDKLSALFVFEDEKGLDLSAALKRRQGQHQAMFHDGEEAAGKRRNRNRGLGRGSARTVGIKRFLFGSPSEDWLRPPAFLAGGLGMDRVTTGAAENEFTFTWSPEFRFLHSQYQFIESCGDPNVLVMFLAHFPYHPAGLMQLSRIYAGMGQYEKSFDLVQRALHVLECASMEAFRPSGALTSRLDPDKEENKIYFEVLIRYLQECSAQGCHSVAMEVCRYLLSLWPEDSSKYQLLLSLDHYIVAAQQHHWMLAFCGLVDRPIPLPITQQSLSGAVADNSVLTEEAEDNTGTTNWTNSNSNSIGDPHVLLASARGFSFTSPYHLNEDHCSTAEQGAEVSLQDMPNWWFSLALSAFTAERRRSATSTSSNINNINTVTNPITKATASTATTTESTLPSATGLLAAALLRWPSMVRPLLEKVTGDHGPLGSLAVRLLGGTSAAAPWRRLLEHDWFRNAMGRAPPSLHPYLSHVSEVYALRNVTLWGKEEELKWLVDTCTTLVTALGSAQRKGVENECFLACVAVQDAQYARLLTLAQSTDEAGKEASTKSPLLQYTRLNGEPHLQELFGSSRGVLALLPGDLNPLDPSLDDPSYILSGAVRFREFMDTEGRFLFPVPTPYVTTAKQARLLETRRGWRDSGNNGVMQRPERANIDLNLPLMQLFLATFFPWIFVPPLARS